MIKEKTFILGSIINIPLFKGFSVDEIKDILSFSVIEEFKKESFIVRENEISNKLYIIIEGTIEILKKNINNEHSYLNKLCSGDIFCEYFLVDNYKQNFSAKALSQVKLLTISKDKFFKENKVLYKLKDLLGRGQHNRYEIKNAHLLNNIICNIYERLEVANEENIRLSEKRNTYKKKHIAIEYFLYSVLISISAYLFLFKIINTITYYSISPTLVNVPLNIFFAIAIYFLIKNNSYNADFYGITLKNLGISIKESVIFSIPWLLALILVKWTIINFLLSTKNISLFDIGANLNNVSLISKSEIYSLLVIGLYFLIIPLQEFITRGVLQGILQDFFLDKYANFKAIFLSNLLFSAVHTHISLLFSILVFVPGLFWGWLYCRHKNLIGVTISHLVIGSFSFFILGFDEIFKLYP
ncbi:MAG: hypothetical protein LEGION0398_MBIBDBAK_01159 [Legionellaceae bacterium]